MTTAGFNPLLVQNLQDLSSAEYFGFTQSTSLNCRDCRDSLKVKPSLPFLMQVASGNLGSFMNISLILLCLSFH